MSNSEDSGWGTVILIGLGLYVVSKAFGGHDEGDEITEDEIGDAEILPTTTSTHQHQEEEELNECHECSSTDTEPCPKPNCDNYICKSHWKECVCNGEHRWSCGCHKNSDSYCPSCD